MLAYFFDDAHQNINLLISYLHHFLDKPFSVGFFKNKNIICYYDKIKQYNIPITIDNLINEDDIKIVIYSNEIDTRLELFGNKIGENNDLNRKYNPILFISYDKNNKLYNAYLNVSSKVETLVYPISLISQKFNNLKIVNCFSHWLGSSSQLGVKGWHNIDKIIKIKRDKDPDFIGTKKKNYKWWHIIYFGNCWHYGEEEKVDKLITIIGNKIVIQMDEQDLDDDYVFLVNAIEFRPNNFIDDDVEYYVDFINEGMTDYDDLDDYL